MPDEAFAAAGVEPRGELWAAMLDTKQSWDDLVRRHAPDAKTRDAILANPLYQNITGRFVQSHDYIAMERLYEIHSSGRYDLIVVDTPPTRNALDFLEAPERMADFFSQPAAALADRAVPQSGCVNVASKPFYQVADRILGSQFLEDIAEFFILFQTMYDGFVERAEAVDAHCWPTGAPRSSSCRTLEAAPAARGRVLHRRARRAQAPPRRARAQQGAARLPRSTTAATAVGPTLLRGRRRRLADELAADARATRRPGRPACCTRWARASSTTRSWPSARPSSAPSCPRVPDVVATVPYFDTDIHDLAGCSRWGEQIWR